MGSSAIRENLVHNHIQSNWADVTYGDQYTIVKNKTIPDLQAQQYVYELDPKRNLEQQLQIYKIRNNLNGPIVKTFLNLNEPINKYFSGQNIMTIVTQRIPYRLSAIPELSEPQAFYVLRQSLRGYSLLYDKVGFFKIDDNMIGVTNNGQVRVWFNTNLALNQPQKSTKLLSARRASYLFQQTKEINQTQQEIMVKNIISIIQSKCKNKKFSQPLHSNLQRQNIGFLSVDSQIQRYSRQCRILIPPRINIKKINQIRKDQNSYYLQNKNTQISNIINSNYTNANQYPLNFNNSKIVPTGTSTYPNQYISSNQNQYIVNSNKAQPMASTSSKTGVKFNYQQPRQYFNPSVMVRR